MNDNYLIIIFIKNIYRKERRSQQFPYYQIYNFHISNLLLN